MARPLLITMSDGIPALEVILLNGVQSGTSEAMPCQNAEHIAFTATYDNGVNAGDVIYESAPTKDYAGTWAQEGNSHFGSNTTDRATVDGPLAWMRARISTPIGVGKVTVKARQFGHV